MKEKLVEYGNQVVSRLEEIIVLKDSFEQLIDESPEIEKEIDNLANTDEDLIMINEKVNELLKKLDWS